jgi:hypothetical protein
MDLYDSRIQKALIASAAGVGDDKAALTVLDHAARQGRSPPISPLGWVLCDELCVLLCTNDQNSSISKVESPRS